MLVCCFSNILCFTLDTKFFGQHDYASVISDEFRFCWLTDGINSVNKEHWSLFTVENTAAGAKSPSLGKQITKILYWGKICYAFQIHSHALVSDAKYARDRKFSFIWNHFPKTRLFYMNPRLKMHASFVIYHSNIWTFVMSYDC